MMYIILNIYNYVNVYIIARGVNLPFYLNNQIVEPIYKMEK